MGRVSLFAAVRGTKSAGLLWAFLIGSTILAAPSALLAQQSSSFAQSLAQAAQDDETVAAWYRDTEYQSLWTDADDVERKSAFLTAISSARDHGLPVNRYDAKSLSQAYAEAETEGDRGRVEVAMTKAYLAWARDLTSGVLTPAKIDPTIVRDIAVEDPLSHMTAIANQAPETVLANFIPKSNVYTQLMKAHMSLSAQIRQGGWGPEVRATTLSEGDSGDAVTALRNRLMAMGYLPRSVSRVYDATLAAAVREFQANHGLEATGQASESTLAEVNRSPEDRLRSIIVALERERWLDIDRTVRHIWVNQPEFVAKIVDHGKTVFQTRVVIGKDVPDQRSPEFSDEMEFLVVNPSWNVPRSITVKEYLPLMQSNRNAVGHLQVIDGKGRVVPRGAVNFAAYSAATFPFALRQPPSDGNALGKVKFMFPNSHNIYLHDTPAKSLFAHEVRAYSHGCIRVAEPFELAHALMSVQSPDAEKEFDRILKTGNESAVTFEKSVPVHLVYFTAYPTAKGKMSYLRDVYGRDAKLFEALTEAGVVLEDFQG